MMMRLLTITILAALAVSGCENQQLTSEQPPDLASPPPGSSIGATLVVAHPDGYTPSTDEDQRYRDFQARAMMRRAVRDAVANAEGWQDADAAVQAALREHPHVPAFEKEQVAAALILQQHLLTAEKSKDPEHLDAISRYTEMLVRHRNPNPVLISNALDDLEGHWPSAKVSRVAESAYSAAERYVAARMDCEGCDIETARRRTTEGAGNTAVNAAIDAALEPAIDGAEQLRARF